MPPKAKYTREQIVMQAMELAADRGVSALTARELAAVLGTSTCPIFTTFKSMGELLSEVRKAAVSKFDEYSEKVSDCSPFFKRVGLQMILFAKEQPKLYRLLFMTEKPESSSFDDIFQNLGDTAVKCVQNIESEYGLPHDKAMQLFRHVWIYTYGIGSLIASDMCKFPDEEVHAMISCQFYGTLELIKSGRAEEILKG